MSDTRDPRRWWALSALMIAVILVGLDTTVLNVALPTLATALRASNAELQWIVDAFILALAGLMLPLGAIGDRIGRRRLLLAGVTLFTAGSLAAAYAGSPGALIATRAAMGVGAAVIMTAPFAVLANLFDVDERPKAIASMTVALGLGLPLGPIVGGWLLQHYWWGSVFLINVPIGLLAVVAVAVLLPESRNPVRTAPDLIGGVLSTAGLIALVYAVVQAPVDGWTSAEVISSGVTGLVVLACFGWWQTRSRAPMIDLRLFSRPRFSWGTASATVAMFAMLGLLFVLPLYLQVVRGNDPLGTGLRLLPLILGLVVGAPLAERATTRLGTRVPIVAGLLVIATALVWASTITVDTGFPLLAAWLALAGAGLGMTMTPAMDAVLGELPAGSAGAGSALSMAMRQTGGALGVAVLGSVANAGYTGRLDVTGLPPAAAQQARESVAAGVAVARQLGDTALADSAMHAYVHATSLVMLSSAGLAVLGAVLVGWRMPPRRTPPVQTAPPESARIEG